MIKRIVLFAVLLSGSFTFGQGASISVHVADLEGNYATGTFALRFDLANCGTAFARIHGQKLVLPYTKTFTAVGGLVSGNLFGNDIIECNGGYNSYYHVSRLYNGQKVGDTRDFIIPDSGTWSLETAVPVKTSPPESLNTYPTISGTITPGDCAKWATNTALGDAGSPCGSGTGTGSGMVYPSAGIAVSTGSAWGTSKAAPTGTIVGTTDPQALTNKDLTGAGNTFPTLNQNTTGTAANLSGTPTLPNGTSATTQTAGDSTTKLATTAFVANAVAATGAASLPLVSPQDYGAAGNVNSYFDGSITAGGINKATGTSTTPSAPAVTTSVNNDVVVAIFGTTAAWSAAPSTGTNRLNVAFVSGKYGIYVNDQTVASAGSVSAVSGTAGNAAWNTATISMSPTAGHSVTFVNATSTQNAAGSGSITISVPTGVTNGDQMISCIQFFSGTITSVPSGWTKLFNTVTSNNNQSCYTHTANSEPASYTWNQSGTTGMSGFILDYINVAALDGAQLSSATASFTAGQVGYPICSETASGSAQLCGKISAYTSSTQVSTTMPATASGTGLWFSFGADDTSALQTMLTTAPCSTVGCQIAIGNKRYGITGSLTFPSRVPVTMFGAGAGVPNTIINYLNSNSLANKNTGSGFWVLSQFLTSGALVFSGGTTSITSSNNTDEISNFSIYGGAGRAHDGCGSDGIDVLNWQGLLIKNVYVGNCSGRGILIDALASGTNLSYIENIIIDGAYVFWSGKQGIAIGAVTGANDLETIGIYNSIIENNSNQGVYLNSKVQGFTLQNSVLQWNNTTAASTELFNNAGATVLGCSVSGNYFEVDANGGSQSTSWVNSTTFGTPDNCNYGSNYYWNGSAHLANPFYSDPLGVTHVGSVVNAVVSGSGTTPAINASSGSWVITLSGNTSPTMTGIFTGLTWFAEVCQPGSGGPYTFTWPASVHGGPTVTTTAGQCTTQQFHSFNGTTLLAVPGASVAP